jgi:pyruvate ferredoxin oxidoreductase delta subunit
MRGMSGRLKQPIRSWCYEHPAGDEQTDQGGFGKDRVFKPVVDKEQCNACGICAMFCPDAAISDDLEVDLDFCKGCGICANECPKKAISMEREEK